MARGINKVTLIGNVGQDPSIKTFPNGGAVTNVSLATSEVWKDKDGKQQERTEWHQLVFHNKLAEIADKYLKKGSRCYVEGAIRQRKYEDRDGKERVAFEIHCYELNLLDSPKENAPPETAGASPKDDDIPF